MVVVIYDQYHCGRLLELIPWEKKRKEGKQNRQDLIAIVVDLTFTMIKCQIHGPKFMECMYAELADRPGRGLAIVNILGMDNRLQRCRRGVAVGIVSITYLSGNQPSPIC